MLSHPTTINFKTEQQQSHWSLLEINVNILETRSKLICTPIVLSYKYAHFEVQFKNFKVCFI